MLQWRDKKYFNKELVITKEDNEDFKNFTKCCICDNDYVDNVKVRDRCHITGKHIPSAFKGCNISFKLNQENSCRIPQPQKSYDSHVIMQQMLGEID